jgi:hypothetical protein
LAIHHHAARRGKVGHGRNSARVSRVLLAARGAQWQGGASVDAPDRDRHSNSTPPAGAG